MGGIAKAKGKQRGAYYEIQVVADIIRIKEANGENTSFERELLKQWPKYPGYESAKEVLSSLVKISCNSKGK